MATKVYMEALSPTMEEGRLITWLKNEGDQVSEGDVLAEVETDKATMELVARGSGVLRRRLIGEGDTQAVGQLIAVIAGADEDISSLVAGDGGGASQQAAPAEEEGEEEEEAEGGSPESAPAEQDQPRAERAPEPAASAEASGDGRVKASPLARKLAAESGLAIGEVRGSGPGGRIVKRDIEAAVAGGGARAEAAEPEAAPRAEAAARAPAPVQMAAPSAADRDVPLSQMRKTIAKRLTQSIGPIPHFFLTIEVDMTEAGALRKKLNERFADQGIKVSPNDIIIKSVAMALRRHPWVNASWSDQAIRQHGSVHIGVAVAVEEGLITPVIRDADRKGIAEIAQEVRELAGRAREKKLKPEEYTGSTFSISNLGMFGIVEFTAVINPPEAAILAVGAVEDKVVVENGEMVVRPRLRVTLSCDHRVIDGATGAEFLQTLRANLEDPAMMLA